MKQSTGTSSTLITLKDIELTLGNVTLKQRMSAEAIAHYYWEDEEPASYISPPVAALFTLTYLTLKERLYLANREVYMTIEPATDVLQYMSDEQCEEMTRLVEEGLHKERLCAEDFEYN